MRETNSRTILSPVTGFLREAGFTHSLSPARNCTYGCQYCYVPTMRIFGGLRKEDWEHWGQFTTLKTNAAALAQKEMEPGQLIYCSPVVDPYQPAEREGALMPGILAAVMFCKPDAFVVQTRGPLILRDVDLLRRVSEVTRLRISFSVTTDREDVRRRYEPHCEPNYVRLETIRQLRKQGLEVYATLAPLLPCNPEALAQQALEASGRDLIGDPLHVRAAKPHGAQSRELALKFGERHGEEQWLDPQYQSGITARIERVARRAGFAFACGPPGFARLLR